MPTTVKNDQGLFAIPAILLIDADAFETFAKTFRTDLAAESWVTAARAASTRQKVHWCALEHQYPRGHALAFPFLPGGFSNETHLWDSTSFELRSLWRSLDRLRSDWDELSEKLKGQGLDSHIDQLSRQLPKRSTLARANQCLLHDLPPGWEARGGLTWAVWMGSPREMGYMDDKQRPAGAASARLFESPAAALRTAKSAHFGSARGPAAIIRLRVECVAVSVFGDGARCEAPLMVMAEREAQDLLAFLEEASLDQVRQALGEPPISPSAPPQRAPAASLAGRELGYACWVDSTQHPDISYHSRCGFVNIRGDLGPVTGSVLRPTQVQAALKTVYWPGRASIVQVACWPEAIETLIGEPLLDPVHLAIDWEASQAAKSNFARQSADALRRRAAALSSGAAIPRQRSCSL